MIILLTIIGFVVTVAVFYWAILKENVEIRVLGASFGLIAMSCLGFYIGGSWQIIRNYETYVFPFSRYSWHLRDLAERQDLAALTNDVIKFDNLFNKHQNARDLEDAVNQAIKHGKYYQITNSAR